MSIYSLATRHGQSRAHIRFGQTIALLRRHHASGAFDDYAAMRQIKQNVVEFQRVSGIKAAPSDIPRLLAWIKAGF